MNDACLLPCSRCEQIVFDNTYFNEGGKARHICCPPQKTLKQQIALAKRHLRAIGIELEYATDLEEFRVNFIGGREATAYYTNDFADAVGTARLMCEARDKIALKKATKLKTAALEGRG